jgi:hypothetical protein
VVVASTCQIPPGRAVTDTRDIPDDWETTAPVAGLTISVGVKATQVA